MCDVSQKLNAAAEPRVTAAGASTAVVPGADSQTAHRQTTSRRRYRYRDVIDIQEYKHLFMAALRSRCGHYIFVLFLSSSSFFLA